MASKENQTYQMVAISGFTVGVLSLGLAAVLYSSYSKAIADLTATKAENTKQLASISEAQSDLSVVKKLFGLDGGSTGTKDVADKLEEIGKRANMTGDGTTELTLVGVTEGLLAKVREREQAADKLQEDLKALDKDRQEDKAAFQANLQKAQDEFIKASKELEQLRSTFTGDRDDINKQKDALVAQLAKLTSTFEAERDSFKEQIKKLTDANRDLRVQRDQLQSEKELNQRDNFDVADGKIVQISRSTKSVYINLGYLDDLPSQASFSVYSEGSENLEAAEKKGVIQVKKIVGPHLAECRIVGPEIRANPMVSNDIIFSAAWQPGRKETFAITGFIDLDDDGIEDLDRLVNLIEVNGGEVVAIVKSDGSSPPGKGPENVTIREKYLITGSEPSTEKGASAEFVAAHTAISNTASEHGVKKVALHKFLDLIGYKPEPRSVLAKNNTTRPKRTPENGPASGTTPSAEEPTATDSEMESDSESDTSLEADSEMETEARYQRRRVPR